MTPVNSSWIAAIGHDPKKNTLIVEMKDGSFHEYAEVPGEKHAALMAAESVGKHLNQHIKPHHAHAKCPPV